MAFVDEFDFHAKAGRGGVGVVRWRHEHSKEWSGASGGNGGRGGDVRVRAVRDLAILQRYRNAKEFAAEKGGDGERNSKHGKDGEDLVIDLPIGSIVTDHRTGHHFQLLEEGENVRILKGGAGGLGNEHFKASTNVTPKQSTDGYGGEEGDFSVELELVADAGFIGLPNAGKSSLLNGLTNANAKVGNYAFTTLEPNLGALHDFVLADIPGLIEGASEGKGLGHKFLRHVRRTRALFHLISLEPLELAKGDVDAPRGTGSLPRGTLGGANPPAGGAERVRGPSTGRRVSEGRSEGSQETALATIISNYKTVRAELERYGHGLFEKPETIILTKTDCVDAPAVEAAEKALAPFATDILSVSILDDASAKALKDEIVRRLRASNEPAS